VARRSAELTASWMVAGFVHGVLNSDNMVVTGESFDYGPYRFLPHYDPGFVAAYFDEIGLYAFDRQPRAVWNNLQRLAASLASIAPPEALRDAAAGFMQEFSRARSRCLFARLGVQPLDPDADQLFSDAVWSFLAETRISYDQFFFDWYGGRASARRALRSPAGPHYRARCFEPVAQGFETFAAARPGLLDPPLFARDQPPTLVIDEIESLWRAIDERDDWSQFEQKIRDIRELGSALRLTEEPAIWPSAPPQPQARPPSC
jgi:serine/tyrosine/threonine adenylyltransferase